jgi:hypothetical protein
MSKEAALRFGDNYRTLDIERYEDEVHFEIDAPWFGDTQSGFGATLSVTLNKAQAEQLGRWLLEQFKEVK